MTSKTSGWVRKLSGNCTKIAVFMTIVGVQNFSNVLKYPENIQNDFFESENVRVLYKNKMPGIFNTQKMSGFCIKIKCPRSLTPENVWILYKNEMSGIFNIEPVWSGGTLAVYHTFF